MTSGETKQSKATIDSRTRFEKFSIGLIVFLCVVAGCAQLWLLASNVPLGVPNEWTWPRFEAIDIFGLLITGLIGTCLVSYGTLGASRASARDSHDRLWLMGLVVLGLIWVNSISAIMPPEGGLSRSVFVLFYPRTTGYYWQAKYEAEDLGKFLSTYEESIQDQSDPENYLHIGTHPPGLTVGYRLLLNLCNASPGLVKTLDSIQPTSVKESLRFIATANRSTESRLSRSDLSALWLAVLLSQFISVLTVIPLYFLSQRICDRQASRMVAVAWVLVPTVLVFLPKSDAVFPCLTCSIQLAWCHALERNSKVWGIVTAISLITAATLSLAFFIVGLILLLQLLHHWFFTRRGLSPTLAGLISGLLFMGLLYATLRVNLPAIWFQNLQNHAVFYDHNTRTSFSWLFVNIIEAGSAIGGPVAVLAIAGSIAMCRRFREPSAFMVLTGLLVWGVLWLTGKNMGEAARLWIFLMPYAVLAIGPISDCLASIQKNLTVFGRNQLKVPIVILILLCVQLVVCACTAITIDGFGFTEL